MSFTWGGRIYLDASVPSGGSADIRFRFERLPYDEADPDATEPSYETETITISGAGTQLYLIDIPPLGEDTFQSLILYIDTRDVAEAGVPLLRAAPEPIYARFDQPFDGRCRGDYLSSHSMLHQQPALPTAMRLCIPFTSPGGTNVYG